MVSPEFGSGIRVFWTIGLCWTDQTPKSPDRSRLDVASKRRIRTESVQTLSWSHGNRSESNLRCSSQISNHPLAFGYRETALSANNPLINLCRGGGFAT